MSRILIVDVQDWETTDKMSGKLIKGKSYIGFQSNNVPIKFTCSEERVCHKGETLYDESKATDVPLKTKLFSGRVSYQCGNCYGKEQG